MSEHACSDCETHWSQAPRPGLKAAGLVVIAVGVGALGAMLWLIKGGDTGFGGGAGLVAMVALGVGMKLTSKTIVRCPSCGATATA